MSRRRVRIADLLGDPLEIELPLRPGETEARVATVHNLGVDDMARLLALEASTVRDGSGEEIDLEALQDARVEAQAALQAALAADPLDPAAIEAANRDFAARSAEYRSARRAAAETERDSLGEMRDFIVSVVERDNPGFFAERVRDEETGETVERYVAPNWTPTAIMALTSALSGNDSVIQEITDGLFGTPEEIEARRADIETERAARAARGEETSEASQHDPLDSTKLSSTPSSTSAGPSTGAPSGGSVEPTDPADAPGARSSLISDTSELART